MYQGSLLFPQAMRYLQGFGECCEDCSALKDMNIASCGCIVFCRVVSLMPLPAAGLLTAKSSIEHAFAYISEQII